MKYKYITTTLPYINSRPHIGHALEFVQADALTRFHRMNGVDVFFNVGVDEHGTKVYNESVSAGINVKDYCDAKAAEWMEFCTRLGIAYSNFYRTSSPHHYAQVQAFWKECVDRGDIYKGVYKGLYCIGCESRKLEKDLINGKCSDHGTVPEMVDEENWFFKLTNYKDVLAAWIESSDFVQPVMKKQELLHLIAECEDISISRNREIVPWGIPVPGDDSQTIYVWFEALLNYIMILNPHYPEVPFADSEIFREYWADSTQLCGPDNIRFQGCIFQAFLASAGLPHTTRLMVHGTVTSADGTKMSKTKGNVVDPFEQIDKFGVDAVRYYALAGISTFYNSPWSERDLVNMANNDLGDNYGNLLARTLHLRNKKAYNGLEGSTAAFRDIVDEYYNRAVKHWNSLHISLAIKETNDLLSFGNKYMNDREPWKSPQNERETLANLYFLLKRATELLTPVVPDICEKARHALDENAKVILFEKIKLEKVRDVI